MGGDNWSVHSEATSRCQKTKLLCFGTANHANERRPYVRKTGPADKPLWYQEDDAQGGNLIDFEPEDGVGIDHVS